MKNNDYVIKNSKGQYIKYGTATSDKVEFTDTLYDAHVFNNRKFPSDLVEYMGNQENIKGLEVIELVGGYWVNYTSKL